MFHITRFYKIHENLSGGPKSSERKPEKLQPISSERMDSLQQAIELKNRELERLSGEEKRLARSEINRMKREMNRLNQGLLFRDESDKDFNIDTISSADIFQKDKTISQKDGKERGNAISKIFAYKQTEVDRNIIEEPLETANVKEGDKIVIDFGKNRSADSKIGAGDMLPVNIQVAKITDAAGNTRTGKRSIQGMKVGYYDENGYIPIHNNYTIEIPRAQEVKTHLESSDPAIVLSTNLQSEEKSKDTFIEIARRYDAMDASFTPWDIESRQEFQKKAVDLAKKIEEKYHIPWQVTYAQTALETGYGKNVPDNNYFGIKGKGGSYQTKEVIDGKEVTVNASFRGYASMEESFEDYAKLLTENNRYKGAFAHKDPKAFLTEVIRSGYATDPSYVAKAENIWNRYDMIASYKRHPEEIVARTTPSELIASARKYLNVDYAWGGGSKRGIDCSHLVCKALVDTGSATDGFYRVSGDLRRITQTKPLQDIVQGDLIFWHGENGVKHVAIATGAPNSATGEVSIIDSSTDTGGVAERMVSLKAGKHTAGTPPFYA